MPMLVADPNLPDCPIAFANKAFCDLTGYGAEELIGRNCRLMQGPDTDPGTVASIHAALERRTDISVEILNYRRDGSPFWNALFIGPVFASDGQLLYFFSSQFDVSRRREAERALIQAQRLEGLGSLAGGIAHEFNNLLTVITGNLELLLRDATDQKMAQRLSHLRQATERATVLTRSMISFARRQRLEDQPIEVAALLERLLPSLRQAVGPDVSLTLTQAGSAAKVLVNADPEQLQTALVNVLTNAREACRKGGSIRIRTELRTSRAGRPLELVVSVTDDGRGMTADVAARAVDPFFSTKPPGAGVGLGLSMAYGFMRQTGGKLQLESVAGRGTTVRLSFPIMREVADEMPLAEARERVLVVDDDAELRDDAATMLRGLGYIVDVAGTPWEALDLLRDSPAYDAMMTDMMMPGMNGAMLAERVRARAPGLPILLTSGFPAPGEGHVLAKPYTRADLATRIRETIDKAAPDRG